MLPAGRGGTGRDGADREGPAGVSGAAAPRPPRGRAYRGRGARAAPTSGTTTLTRGGETSYKQTLAGTAARTPSPPAKTGGAALFPAVPRLPLPLAEDAAVGRRRPVAAPASPILPCSGVARRRLPAGDVSKGRPLLPRPSRRSGRPAPPGPAGIGSDRFGSVPVGAVRGRAGLGTAGGRHRAASLGHGHRPPHASPGPLQRRTRPQRSIPCGSLRGAALGESTGASPDEGEDRIHLEGRSGW
ncbi:collagen alpha-1(III) chain-like [Prinia subflava]|uniref:collagen alpha-1(III) chain-like n=1 Tax=Prinia subflava TaxID=208062 RepID=UPI002FE02BF8